MTDPIKWDKVEKPPIVNNASPALQKARLAICYDCPHLQFSGCELCGCNIEQKTLNRKESCPIHKW